MSESKQAFHAEKEFSPLIIPDGDVLIQLSDSRDDSILMPSAYLKWSGFWGYSLLRNLESRRREEGFIHPYQALNQWTRSQVLRFVLSFVGGSPDPGLEGRALILKDGVRISSQSTLHCIDNV